MYNWKCGYLKIHYNIPCIFICLPSIIYGILYGYTRIHYFRIRNLLYFFFFYKYGLTLCMFNLHEILYAFWQNHESIEIKCLRNIRNFIVEGWCLCGLYIQRCQLLWRNWRNCCFNFMKPHFRKKEKKKKRKDRKKSSQK